MIRSESWFWTLDHKRIAWMYLVTIGLALLAGGIAAMLMRTQLLVPRGLLFSNPATYRHYNQTFTFHGVIMVFMVLVPAIPAIFGNFNLPLMLGIKDLAFPRLNLGSYYLFLLGAAMALLSMLISPPDTGWTFYTPYSAQTPTAVSPMALAIFILGWSSVFTALNFLVTLHTLRPAWMSWWRMPLFLWSLYATSMTLVLATPVLGVTLLMLILERAFHLGLFTSQYGGDPVLFQHFFWFYSHPAVYIMILPAMGVISEVLPVFARRHIFGYSFIAVSSLAIGGIGFLVWGHHMFIAGQSAVMGTVFSFLTYMVAIPSAVKVFNWVATLYRGSIRFQAPMLYALGFIWLFTFGGLTGLFLGALSVNVHVHDTYFVIAHFHYIMVGGTMMGLLAALHYWWPKMTGRMYPEAPAMGAFWCVFLGYNITFLPQFFLGLQGMPRRYAHYLPEFQSYHVLSTLGAYLQVVGFFWVLIYLLRSWRRGPKALRNPWGAVTLEWQSDSPPPTENFHTPPRPVLDPYDFSILEYDPHRDSFELKAAPEVR